MVGVGARRDKKSVGLKNVMLLLYIVDSIELLFCLIFCPDHLLTFFEMAGFLNLIWLFASIL